MCAVPVAESWGGAPVRLAQPHRASVQCEAEDKIRYVSTILSYRIFLFCACVALHYDYPLLSGSFFFVR